MSVANILRKLGYAVEVNYMFLDLEEEKPREIDLIATKEVAGVNIVFVIECKQSSRDSWIFVAPESNPSRYYRYAKHMPMLRGNSDYIKECFSRLHIFDRKIPLSNNVVSFEFDKKKKSDPTAINDAIKKAVKATLSVMTNYRRNNEEQEKGVFFSAVFFSGDIFLASYNKSLNVTASSHLIYKDNFVSSAYTDISGPVSLYPIHHFGTQEESISYEEREKRKMINITKKIYTSLKPDFIVDIVKDKYIKKYIALVEESVSTVPVERWPNNEKETCEFSDI